MLKNLLISVGTLALLTTLGAEAATKAAPKKEPPPPDYFPVRLYDAKGNKIDWWWKYTYTTYKMNGNPVEKKPDDFKLEVVAEEKQPDQTIHWKIDTTSPSMTKTIHEWYIKQKGKVVWHKEQFGDEPTMLVEYQPERVLLTNPAKKDDTWPWQGKGNMGIAIDNTSVVSGPEEVVTPAGKFQAMKVTVTGTQGGQPINMTYWYAPWIGLVKTGAKSGPMESESSLLDYSFKKPAHQTGK
ncbi:hypothetical protein KF707_09570 [Candidatus Obscuribacterales bacterium]|nr:hypothetical protein [Candidatus Obscuribacterales bacterium]